MTHSFSPPAPGHPASTTPPANPDLVNYVPSSPHLPIPLLIGLPTATQLTSLSPLLVAHPPPTLPPPSPIERPSSPAFPHDPLNVDCRLSFHAPPTFSEPSPPYTARHLYLSAFTWSCGEWPFVRSPFPTRHSPHFFLFTHGSVHPTNRTAPPTTPLALLSCFFPSSPFPDRVRAQINS